MSAQECEPIRRNPRRSEDQIVKAQAERIAGGGLRGNWTQAHEQVGMSIHQPPNQSRSEVAGEVGSSVRPDDARAGMVCQQALKPAMLPASVGGFGGTLSAEGVRIESRR